MDCQTVRTKVLGKYPQKPTLLYCGKTSANGEVRACKGRHATIGSRRSLGSHGAKLPSTAPRGPSGG